MRRRIVLLVGIIAAIALIWLLIAQPWRGAASPTADPGAGGSTGPGVTELPVPQATSSTPAATSTPPSTPTTAATKAATPSPNASAAASGCRPGDIDVKPVTDKTSYATAQNPQLSIRLTNHGTTACTMNVGTSAQVFTITSGTDSWWRSTDCQKEPSDMVVVLAAGQTVKSAVPLTWDRTRSSVSTCASANRPRAPGGGATYHLAVEIGGITSTEDAQFLLY